MFKFTIRDDWDMLLDIPISFIILLPGFIVIFFKLTYNCRNRHSYCYTSHEIYSN